MNDGQDDVVEINDLADDHDQIMAHFQEVTDFYDMEQCQAILESTQWNLDQAIQSFFSGAATTNHMDEDIVYIPDMKPSATPAQIQTRTLPPPPHIGFTISDIMGTSNDLDAQMQGIFATGTSITPVDSLNDKKKTSNRLINFNIEYFQKKFTLHMPDNETVLSLKELIEQEINLPVKNQKLKVKQEICTEFLKNL